VTGYGVIGDPMSVPWLIRMIEVEKFARVAGESFTMITGVDIVRAWGQTLIIIIKLDNSEKTL